MWHNVPGRRFSALRGPKGRKGKIGPSEIFCLRTSRLRVRAPLKQKIWIVIRKWKPKPEAASTKSEEG